MYKIGDTGVAKAHSSQTSARIPVTCEAPPRGPRPGRGGAQVPEGPAGPPRDTALLLQEPWLRTPDRA